MSGERLPTNYFIDSLSGQTDCNGGQCGTERRHRRRSLAAWLLSLSTALSSAATYRWGPTNIPYNLKNHQPSDPSFLLLLETQFPILETRSLT